MRDSPLKTEPDSIGVAEPLVALACRTGENPLWHPDEQCLYWSDIPSARLHRCRADGSQLRSFAMDAPVGGFTLQADGSLLLFMARGAVRIWREGRFLATVLEEIPAERDGRFNDVIADPQGRVFAGTLSTENHRGRFYRLDPDRTPTLLADDMGTPNGMGFSPDLKYFYQNDTRASVTYRYRYDAETGSLCEREVFWAVAAEAGRGRPDGLTVDADGYVWTARWGGGRAVRLDPAGREEREIVFPVPKVSSLTFGGPTLADAYFTTAGGDRRAQDGELAGSLFACRAMPAPGRPEFRSRMEEKKERAG
jgi:D-xylono/L-arabinono-1,4-lactonase